MDTNNNKRETPSPPEPTPIQHNTPKNHEASIYAKSDSTTFLNTTVNNNRKGSTSSTSSIGHSFTQRLIERGVAVPSSFSGWFEKVGVSGSGSRTTTDDNSSVSPGSSFDFDTYYGMSPFITPSFNANTGNDGPLYKSLRHRYEKEKVNHGESTSGSSVRMLSEDGEVDSTSELQKKLQQQEQQQKKKRTEDSDIELSDEEEEEDMSSTPTQEKLLSATLVPLNQRSRRSRSPLAFTLASRRNSSFKKEDTPEEEQEEKPIVLSPASQRLKNFLVTKPAATPTRTSNTQQQKQLPNKSPRPLPSPPRRHLLQTPVFQVINANTVKDRYLFLFNDLLLICKPIMDENIIVSSSSNRNSIVEKNRYRFRPNENSLFQVKNIVQLGQLTLYISKDDYHTKQAPATIEIGPDGRPILPPARKIHPIMASALRKFETNANLGIQYLIDKGVLPHDPLSIANFLFKTPDLNRRQLGYYLSDLKNSDIYDAFLECFRLVGLRLDEALRILLTTFRLPSHWEALEYLIERFAKKWHDANQNVIKFHEDMVVKVVVAMLFLNAECWYDATSERDIFWYARELKERQDRQAKRKMSVIDYHRNSTTPFIASKLSNSAATASSLNRNLTVNLPNTNRQSVTVEPLHYITALRAKGLNKQPSLDEFVERWNYYDQYHLVPREFMEEMYKSIMDERLETGWDNKTGRRMHLDELDTVNRPKIVSPSVQQGSQDVVITVIPHRLPTSLTKGVASDPITVSIPAPDKGLQIKLRGQDLVFVPNVLDFSSSCVQTFTITGNTLGRTSLMFIKSGENAGNYVSPTLPRTKSVVVERPFMRFTFQVGFKHFDHEKKSLSEKKEEKDNKSIKYIRKEQQEVEAEADADAEEREEEKTDNKEGEQKEGKKQDNMVNRKYTFSVETQEERIEWLEALKSLSGHVNEERNEKSLSQLNNMNSENRVALQVLKEVLLADEIKKGTARTASGSNIAGSVKSVAGGASTTDATDKTAVVNTIEAEESNNDNKHGRTMKLLLPSVVQQKKKVDETDRNSMISIATTTTTATATANVVTKRGYEIVKLVVQNSMVPLVLGFLVNQISKS